MYLDGLRIVGGEVAAAVIHVAVVEPLDVPENYTL